MSRAFRSAAALAAALVLAACSTSAEDPASQPADSPSAGTGNQGGEDQAGDDAAQIQETEEKLRDAAGQDSTAVPEELPVIASRNVSGETSQLEVDLNSVTASGEVMNVMFTVRNVGDATQAIDRMFDDGLHSAPLADGGHEGEIDPLLAYTTDGVTVLDPAESTMYRAAYDDSGACACSGNLHIVNLEPGDAVLLTTAFAAPPEQTKSVTVDIPLAGSFENVSLTR